jgi:all-trans-retinol dehydrogenase (NAD+)
VHPTWVRTPLIEMLSKKEGWSEFTIETATVADAVVAQVLKGESAQLIVPGRYSLVPLLRGAPSWLQEGMRNSVKDVLRNAWAPA